VTRVAIRGMAARKTGCLKDVSGRLEFAAERSVGGGYIR
jgi:hypothetical protein